ncbi:putative 3-ketodihydrosphingosine reductase tsc-10 [Triangularia verruculosa]|uniref:3-ketodihydrosphingosine reductase tsc-10 n=1 Tax=Triangularia verruculosa TaxID=2587418 RepID=A0AAN6X553_9PEZI|nr:putative 3-ketodihydrosphingosine reductase tsc-10 [Triangularia verruculosa]
MTSTVSRPQRGRPNKVTKPQPTARGRPTRGVVPGTQLDVHAHQIHQQAQAQAQAHQQAQAQYGVHAAPYVAAAQHAQHALEELKPEPDHSVFDNVGVDVGVGVGVPMGVEDYAAAAMESELGNVDAHGEAEPDADMEEDDHSVGGSGLQQHVDLSTANMLANSGANVVGGGVVGQSVHDHIQEMQQGLAHAQQQQQHQQQQHQHQPQQHQQQQHQQHQQQPQAQMSAPQQMEPQVMGLTEDLARESGYHNLSVESALAKRLAREPGRRLANQRRPEQSLNLNRRSNVEALFAHISGTLAPQPCKNCHKGHGPWSTCVVVDGQMCGSCANCWFNASGARCSFHETRTQQPMAQHPGIIPTAGAALPADANYRYTPTHSLLPPAHSNAMQAINFTGGGVPSLNNNPLLQQLVSKAMSEVRAADRATRLFYQLEVTAKQLALQYAEYEEATAGQNQPGGAGNQIGTGQHGMGDDGSA